MKVLITKMSSLGDVLHTLPALTDAGEAIPGIEFDWVVEESFAQLPSWHPLVKKVIPLAFRRLRKTPLKSLFSKEWRAFKRELRKTHYDLVIDAQGLIKSALIARLARGPKAGLDKNSIWEKPACLAYQHCYAVNPELHAVQRVRGLFAQALGYDLPTTSASYGIDRQQFVTNSNESYFILLHGTTWVTKLWPEAYWIELAKLMTAAGYQVRLPWGNEEEKARAERIAAQCEQAIVLPKLSLNAVTQELAGAKGIVAVDTGLGHVAAALAVPTVSIYGPTDPNKTGTVGDNQIHLAAQFECAPCLQRQCQYRGASEVTPACFTTVTPQQVWGSLRPII